MKKIIFENKLASLDIDSKYIVSSINVNEIKSVVNSVSNTIFEQLELDKINYRYIFIKLPNNIDKKYDIEIETSIDNWKTDIHTLKLSTDFYDFLIFENGIFKNLQNNYISPSESGKIIVVNIENLIIKTGKTLCRFKFKNIANNVYTKYFSVDLNVNTKINENKLKFINNNFFTIADLKYKDHICKLLNIGIDLNYILNSINYTFYENTEIQLFSFIYNGESIIDVTSSTNYSSNNNEIIFNEHSFIQPIKTSIFKRYEINSIINYDEKYLNCKCNICLNPIYLCDIEASFDSINYLNKPYNVNFYAKYSNQTFLNIKDDPNFIILIKNNNFSYDKNTGILTPLVENSVDEITIKYTDHDFLSEYFEKTYILKIEGKKISNIIGKINNEYLTSIDNKINYTVSAFYNDNSVEDITYNENLEVTFFNNKIKSYNTLSLNKEDAEIEINKILYNDEKFISFSFFDDKSNKTFYSLNKISLIKSSNIFSAIGIMIVSNGVELFNISFETPMKDLEEIKIKTVNEDLSQYKKISDLTYNISFPNDEYNYDLNKHYTYNNKNCYYKADIYALNLPINNKLLIKSVILPNSFNFYKDENYQVEFKTVSTIPGAKFAKNVEIEVNKNFDENYIIGFKSIKFPIINKNKKYNIIELIGLSGIFESSTEYEFEKSFIYDEFHDIWLIDSVPLKANKLKKLIMNFSYLDEVDDSYPWFSWNNN